MKKPAHCGDRVRIDVNFLLALFSLHCLLPEIFSVSKFFPPTPPNLLQPAGKFYGEPFTPFFVENKGQFNQYDANNSAVDFVSPSYGSQMGNAIVLFNGSSFNL